MPEGYTFRDTGDSGAIHLFSGAIDIGCALDKADRDAYAALVELWDRQNGAKPQ